MEYKAETEAQIRAQTEQLEKSKKNVTAVEELKQQIQHLQAESKKLEQSKQQCE